jgi:hypothetical protein
LSHRIGKQEKYQMHGLMADRLLKRFLKGLRRRSQIVSIEEADLKLESTAEVTDRSNCLENDQPQRKEAVKNIETTNEIPIQIHQNGGLAMTSGAVQLPDDPQETK